MSTALSPGDILTPAQVANLLGVKVQTLAVWRCTGRHNLPFVLVGSLPRYRRADVEAWIDNRTVTNTGQLVAQA